MFNFKTVDEYEAALRKHGVDFSRLDMSRAECDEEISELFRTQCNLAHAIEHFKWLIGDSNDE